MLSSARLAFLFGLFLFATPCFAQAQEEIGFVDEVVGTWLVAGDTVRLARAVHLGDEFVLESATPRPQVLSVVLYDGQRLEHVCHSLSCDNPFSPGDHYRPQSLSDDLSRVFAAVAGVFRSAGASREVELIGRGVRGPREAVVELSNERLDLTPFLGNLPKGSYALVITRLVRPVAHNELELDWDPDAPRESGSVEASSFGTGLHEIAIEPTSTEVRTPPTSYWVLLADSGSYSLLADDFEKARGLVEAWELPPNSSPVREFLRAYLKFLSDRTELP